MGCITHKNKIKIKTKNEENEESSEQISELNLISKIIQERNATLKLDPISTLEINKKDEIKDEFYEDTNNEEILCKYLDELINSNKKEYQLVLFLYFDVLSIVNKKKYTNLNISSNIDIFRTMIISIKEKTFKKEPYLNDLGKRKILFEEKIITIFPTITKLFESKNKYDNNKFEEILKSEIENILKEKIDSKISINNLEVYFQELIIIYAEKFSKLNDDDDDENFQSTYLNFCFIYPAIMECIDTIKKKKYSFNDENYFLLIFFAPIIGHNLEKFSKFFENNTNDCDEDFIFNTKDKELIISNSDNKEIIKFPNYDAINKRIIINEFKNYVKFKIENVNKYLLVNCVKPKYFQKYNFYNYNKKNWEFNTNLLKYILKSNMIKSLIDYLRPELKEVNIFDDNTIKIIIDSIIFVPYKLAKAYGATSKTFLKIFINGLSPKFIKKEIILNSSSSFQIVGIHEITGNWIYGFISFRLKNNLLYNSVSYKNFKIQNLDDVMKAFGLANSDGGEIIEKILFSRVMEYTTIKEMLFILCKNSYNSDYIKFRTNFQNINNIDIENIYKEVIKDEDLKKYLELLGIDIQYLKAIEDYEHNLKYKRNGDVKKSACATKYINML